jgi:hypothetical protein
MIYPDGTEIFEIIEGGYYKIAAEEMGEMFEAVEGTIILDRKSIKW